MTILVISILLLLAQVHALQLLQLGDSYTSGNGARDENGQPAYVVPLECFRSTASWGAQAADRISTNGVDSLVYANLACSGSDMGDIMEQLQASLVTSLPDLVVTLTVGANDLDFRTAVDDCLAPPRDAEDCQESIDFANNNLGEYEQDLTALLVEIHGQLPDDAVVILVGYPHLSLDVPCTFDESLGGGEVELTNQFRDFGDAMEAAQQRAVDAANQQVGRDFCFFFSTKSLFAGREPHPSFFLVNNDGWIWEFQQGDAQIAELYHPNPVGHAALGSALVLFLASLGIVPPPPPTPPPVSPPTPSPGGACFSGTAQVETEHRGTIPIHSLQVGDSVRSNVRTQEFTTFVGFLHEDATQSTTFLQIQCVAEQQGTTTTRVLELTPDHLVYANGFPLPAHSLRIGDPVDTTATVSMQVASIQTVHRRGFYAPATVDGKIVVNGVQASNYITLSRNHHRWVDTASEIALYHAVLAPWRWYQQYSVAAFVHQYFTSGGGGPPVSGSSMPLYVSLVFHIGWAIHRLADWLWWGPENADRLVHATRSVVRSLHP